MQGRIIPTMRCALVPRRRVAVLAVAVSLAGCASWSTRHQPGQKAETPAGPGTAPAVAAVDEPDANVLASVEEFLDRTTQYRASSPVPSAPPQSSSPGTRSPAVAVPAKSAVEGSPPAVDPDNAARREAVMPNIQVSLGEPTPARPPPSAPRLEALSVSVPAPPVVTAAAGHAANGPLDTRRVDESNLADRYVAQLRNVAVQRGDFDSEWALRLTQIAAGRVPDPLRQTPALSKEAATLLDAMCGTASAVRSTIVDPANDGREATARADALMQAMGDATDPQIVAVAICRKVLTFGVYEELAPSDLVAGRSIQAIIYTEIRNLRAEPVDGGQVRSLVGTRLELLATDGRSVWEHEEPEIVDVCRRRRTDFFIAQRVSLPATLAAGDYTLKVTVEDRLSQRVDERNMPVSVLAAPSVAKAP